VVRDLRLAADSFAERHHFNRPALVGPPVLLADGFTSIELDGRRLAIVGMLLIGLVTLTMTWSLWWSVVPILAGWVVWLAAEAIMASLGLRLSLSGGPLVAQIIVLTMPAASHLASHFRDELRGSADRLHAAKHTLRVVSAPILWCAVTGAIGYGALVTSNVVPIRQFGLILGVCTLTAAVLTMLISPVAMKPPFRMEITVRPGSTSKISTVLNWITEWVERHPLPIVVGALAIALPLTLGMLRLDYESNYINAFKPDSRIVQDYRAIETRLGGIGVVSLVVPSGQEITPETIRTYERLDDQILDLRQADGKRAVSHVLSLATVLDPEGLLAALPPDQFADALAAKLELIKLSPQSDLLGNFWNPEGGWARLMMRVSERQPAPVKEATFAGGLGLVRSQAYFGPRSYLTGLSFLLTQTTKGVMATSWTTFLWTAASILLMLAIAFGGPKLASLALLPTLLAVGLVLGLSGWLGVKLDIATALVASVALGLSVDDTFHCLLQFRRLRRELPFREALLASYAVSGPGVLLSSLAVALGFAVLRFSEFVPFSNFGAMVGVATLGSSLGNLILLPACLTLGHRWSERLASKAPSPLEVESPLSAE
ncbi:MAG: MMPL family transporter, partial [Isosphaeraceae bacterium]